MDKTGGMEAVIRKRVDLARSAFSPRKMCMEDSGSQHNIAVCTMTIWNTDVITVLLFSPWEKWWKTGSIRNYVWSLPPSYPRPAPVITEITHGTCTCVLVMKWSCKTRSVRLFWQLPSFSFLKCSWMK